MLKGIIISAQNSGLSGYLKASDIDKIFFVTQTFIEMLSKSVRFYDKNGENIFKIYIPIDENKKLLQAQKLN